MRIWNKFFCLMLTLALLLTSTVALAEEVAAESGLTMQTISLSDFQMSVNDESILDLSGLSLSMGGAMDPYTGKGAAQLSVLGGDAAAASVNAAWDDSKAVLSVDGLSQPLTLDIEALLAQMFSEENMEAMMAEIFGIMSEEDYALVSEMLEACTELFSEENLSATMEGYDAYMARVMEITEGCMSEPVVETHTFANSGEVEAQHITLTFTEEDTAALVEAVMSFYDSNPAFLKLINATLKMEGEEPIDSFTELSGIGEAIATSCIAEIYVSEDGSEIELTMDIQEEGETQGTFDMTGYVTDDTTIMDMQFGIEDEEPISMNLSLSITPNEQFEGEQDFMMTLDAVAEGEPVSFSLLYGPDETFGHMGVLTVEADGESVGFAFSNSDTQTVFAIYDDYMSMEMGYIVENQGEEADEGTLYFHMDDGTDQYVLSASVHTTTSTISEAEIDEMLAVEGIDVMTISEEDISTLTNELLMVSMEAVGVLGQNVPALAELMGSTMEEAAE